MTPKKKYTYDQKTGDEEHIVRLWNEWPAEFLDRFRTPLEKSRARQQRSGPNGGTPIHEETYCPYCHYHERPSYFEVLKSGNPELNRCPACGRRFLLVTGYGDPENC